MRAMAVRITLLAIAGFFGAVAVHAATDRLDGGPEAQPRPGLVAMQR
jgi:hypothetical protein